MHERPMDPLSDVLSLLKPRSVVAGGWSFEHDMSVRFQAHDGIKCYAVISGQCWLMVGTVAEPVLLRDGDCFLLPRGLPFTLTTDPSLEPMDFMAFMKQKIAGEQVPREHAERYMVGGFFALTGGNAQELLSALPPIVHIRAEADKETMRWSLERMRQEVKDPSPADL